LEKPDLLPILQKTPRIARCFEEVLNSKTVIIKPGSVDALRQALAEMGLLVKFD
jgi:DNA polymerase II small subunit/DNA polymerase delta subunit B